MVNVKFLLEITVLAIWAYIWAVLVGSTVIKMWFIFKEDHMFKILEEMNELRSATKTNKEVE